SRKFLPEPRRKWILELLSRVERASPLDKRQLFLRDTRVGDAAIDRTYDCALLFVKKTDAFAAFVRGDVINVLAERRMLAAAEFPSLPALVDGGQGWEL